MYSRWIVDLSPQQEAGKKIGEIFEKNRTAKSKVQQLRRKLLDLETEAEKLGLSETKLAEKSSEPKIEIPHVVIEQYIDDDQSAAKSKIKNVSGYTYVYSTP